MQGQKLLNTKLPLAETNYSKCIKSVWANCVITEASKVVIHIIDHPLRSKHIILGLNNMTSSPAFAKQANTIPVSNTVSFSVSCSHFRSHVSSGSIVSDYGLDDRAIGVQSPAGAKDFSSNLCVQTGSGAHPASCPMGTGGPFPGGKARPGRDADHSPPSSAEVMN
jgi:hypothetical protein